jgi:hypothetical protein
MLIAGASPPELSVGNQMLPSLPHVSKEGFRIFTNKPGGHFFDCTADLDPSISIYRVLSWLVDNRIHNVVAASNSKRHSISNEVCISKQNDIGGGIVAFSVP